MWCLLKRLSWKSPLRLVATGERCGSQPVPEPPATSGGESTAATVQRALPRSPKPRLGACKLAATSRVNPEVSDEVRRASGFTQVRHFRLLRKG